MRDKFEIVDTLVRRLPDHPHGTVRDLAGELLRIGPDAMSRARAVFTWIADHVAYDTKAYFSGQRSAEEPEAVLRSRLAVCAGYAQLYDALCQAVGVRSEIVTGTVKGAGFSVGDAPDAQDNHAWNAFQDENGWHLVDATWGAGSLDGNRFQRGFRPFYFDARPDQIVFTHLPRDSRWQALEPTVGRSIFASLPVPASEFYTHGLGLDSHVEALVPVDRKVMISLIATRPISLIYSLGEETEEAVVHQGKAYFPIVLPRPGVYPLHIFAHPLPCPPGAPHTGVLSYRLVWNR